MWLILLYCCCETLKHIFYTMMLQRKCYLQARQVVYTCGADDFWLFPLFSSNGFSWNILHKAAPHEKNMNTWIVTCETSRNGILCFRMDISSATFLHRANAYMGARESQRCQITFYE